MENNSEKIISILTNTRQLLYEQLEKLVAVKANTETIRVFISALEALEQRWLGQGNQSSRGCLGQGFRSSALVPSRGVEEALLVADKRIQELEARLLEAGIDLCR